mgnify:CR=1 FL=1
MTLPIALLSAAAALCAALTIAAKYRQSKRLEYVCKPLATASILLIALLAEDPLTVRYQALIVLGLAASLAGDVFLMLPDRFLPGLLSFLVAHLFYVAAFTLDWLYDYRSNVVWVISKSFLNFFNGLLF